MQKNTDRRMPPNVIGLIPCAGQANRLPPLPCSKEIYPLGFATGNSDHPIRSRLACDSLLGHLRRASITDAFLVLREGKWDIPACLGDGSSRGMHFAYLMMGLPFGVPYTVNQAFPFIQNRMVALGFPDILFDSDNAFQRLVDRQALTHADLVVGYFPADRPDKCDMIAVSAEGRLEQIVIKPQQTDLIFTWGIALWTPAFSAFLNEFLRTHQEIAADADELFLGDVFRAAIESGMHADAVQVSDEPYLDIGTSDDLQKAICRVANNC
ncbi:MAG: sugar phosphate nucleotidyltransferase [Thiogranum sp.]|nr:sugar phosphate nucleotidyltransferase [Thiogranum sp.]